MKRMPLHLLHYLKRRRTKKRGFLLLLVIGALISLLAYITYAYHMTPNFTGRHLAVQKGCQYLEDSEWLTKWPALLDLPKLASEPFISTKRRVMVCVVGDMASSFFSRWMLAIDKVGLKPVSPLDIPRQSVGLQRVQSLANLGAQDVRMRFLESSTKVVFGQNPFTRLFSVYIDKLFIPNPIFWKHWGVEAIKDGGSLVTHCGSQVTFRDFVVYATSSLIINDEYIRQVADACNMCEMYYDVIGQLETLTWDLDKTSELIGVSSTFQHAKDYDHRLQEDMMIDTIKETFSYVEGIGNCISMDQMGLRLWRGLQIKGFIDSAISFPFQPGEMDIMSQDDFIRAAKGAAWYSRDAVKLRKQKRHAMEEAYLDLNLNHMYNIIGAYAKDFYLFGYTTKPGYLCDENYRRNVKKTTAQRWDIPWNYHYRH